MPSSMVSNPASFLRPSGGVPPSGGMFTGSPNPLAGGGGGDDGSGGGDGGGDPSGGGGLPPELAQMGAARALLPQILAQQQSDYVKKFLKQIGGLLSEAMRQRGIGPKTVSHIAHAVTSLTAAGDSVDKEKPDANGPVQSLLASSMMQRPQMGTPAGQAGLPIMR